MSFNTNQELYFKKEQTVAAIIAEINAATCDDINGFCRQYLDLGPGGPVHLRPARRRPGLAQAETAPEFMRRRPCRLTAGLKCGIKLRLVYLIGKRETNDHQCQPNF